MKKRPSESSVRSFMLMRPDPLSDSFRFSFRRGRTIKKTLFLLAVAGLLAACGGDGDNNGGGDIPVDRGVAPSISNLTITPDSAQIGEGGGAISVHIEMDFIDPDGDVDMLRVQGYECGTGQWTSHDGDLPGMTGLTTGILTIDLAVDTYGCPAGSVETIDFSAFDLQGHKSNTLTGTFSYYEPTPPDRTDLVLDQIAVAYDSLLYAFNQEEKRLAAIGSSTGGGYYKQLSMATVVFYESFLNECRRHINLILSIGTIDRQRVGAALSASIQSLCDDASTPELAGPSFSFRQEDLNQFESLLNAALLWLSVL